MRATTVAFLVFVFALAMSMTSDASHLRVLVAASSAGVPLDAIQEFDASGFPTTTLVSGDNPRSSLTVANGFLYAQEKFPDHSLVRYELDGSDRQVLHSFGGGGGTVVLYESDSQGNIYALEDRTVYRFDADGNIDLQFEKDSPFGSGIDADAEGNIFVSYFESVIGAPNIHGIDKYDAHGKFVTRLLLPKTVNPFDFAIDETGQRLFTNGQNGSIAIVDISNDGLVLSESIPVAAGFAPLGISYSEQLDSIFIAGIGFAGQFATDGTLIQEYHLFLTSTPFGVDIVAIVPEPIGAVAISIGVLGLLAIERRRTMRVV